LDESDEDIDLKLSPENESSVNTGNDQDLMNFNTGVLPHVVESLAETVGQVDLRGQESGSLKLRIHRFKLDTFTSAFS
jgi:hypothetical protein